jgi:hypothetical protein|tara:strand:+ start:69 stop:341 length:273 start_codon:yes stop_codon:yes gene_type:complete
MNYNEFNPNYAAPAVRPEQQKRPLTLFNTPQTSTQAQVAALRQQPAAPVRQALPKDAGLIARIRDNMAGGKANYNGLVGRGVSAFLNRSR